MDRRKLQVKIDGEWKELIKIEEVDYKNFEWGEDKTYAKYPLRSSGEVNGKVKVRKVPLSNGKSCTDFLKLWKRIKENNNEVQKRKS